MLPTASFAPPTFDRKGGGCTHFLPISPTTKPTSLRGTLQPAILGFSAHATARPRHRPQAHTQQPPPRAEGAMHLLERPQPRIVLRRSQRNSLDTPHVQQASAGKDTVCANAPQKVITSCKIVKKAKGAQGYSRTIRTSQSPPAFRGFVRNS